MTEDEINSEAFNLIDLIEKSSDIVRPINPSVGSAKERGIIDWSDRVIPIMIQGTLNPRGEMISMYLSNNVGKFGFNELNYKLFDSFIKNIFNSDSFKGKASVEFLRKKSFEWLIEIYFTKVFKNNLSDFLKSEIVSNSSEFQFYFPIMNLDIEQSFKIGNVEFIYFTQEYFDELFQSLKNLPTPITEEQFKSTYVNDYKGKVLAKVSVKSESTLAESIALKDASIAIDVLKMYGDTLITPEAETNFDLIFRLNYQLRIDYLSQDVNKQNGLTSHFKSNHTPFPITIQRVINDYTNKELQAFSDFIKLKNNDELYNLIIQAINMFATALSNRDLHLRIIGLITILESLLLKDEEDFKMAQKVNARLSKILTTDFKEKEKIKLVFESIYEIRSKMVHKAIRLPIDMQQLRQAQIAIIKVLLGLIRFNTQEKYTLKASLIDTLNSINS